MSVPPVAISEQVTPRIAANAEAAVSLALLSPRTRTRLLATLDLLAEMTELIPVSSAAWDAERQPCGSLSLAFGSVAVRYRSDEPNAGLLLESVAVRFS